MTCFISNLIRYFLSHQYSHHIYEILALTEKKKLLPKYPGYSVHSHERLHLSLTLEGILCVISLVFIILLASEVLLPAEYVSHVVERTIIAGPGHTSPRVGLSKQPTQELHSDW